MRDTVLQLLGYLWRVYRSLAFGAGLGFFFMLVGSLLVAEPFAWTTSTSLAATAAAFAHFLLWRRPEDDDDAFGNKSLMAWPDLRWRYLVVFFLVLLGELGVVAAFAGLGLTAYIVVAFLAAGVTAWRNRQVCDDGGAHRFDAGRSYNGRILRRCTRCGEVRPHVYQLEA